MTPIVQDYINHLRAIKPSVTTQTRLRHANKALDCLSVMKSKTIDEAQDKVNDELGLHENADYIFGGPIPSK